ncbi:patatin-like phospholipase family protein [Vibrio sp. WXL103]|uniref:patatin-like phospholipase family protein n=1 Tax=Vibrio sp. WXL103 TaxID=3450710 RepID=UPI003EC87EC3
MENRFALVVQGGGQKGAFAAGVLDYFKKQQFDPFSLYLGTSAGALNIAAYVAGQQGLGLDFILNYSTHNRFFDLNKFLRKEQPMDLDWAFQFVETGEFPLDIERGRQRLGSTREALACITHVEEMKDYYYPIFADNWFDVLRATCAIPVLYFNDIEFDGATWVDGGVTASVPIQEAYRRGATEIVVITTEQILETKQPDRFDVSIERFKTELETGLEPLIAKYGLHGHRDKLVDFRNQFVDKLSHWQQTSREDIFGVVPREWLPDTDKLTQMLAEQKHRLNLSKPSSQKVDMLVNHYVNHEAVKEFMREPPKGVIIHEIAPSNSLLTKGLMSSRKEILSDYESGQLAGFEFLNRLQEREVIAEK